MKAAVRLRLFFCAPEYQRPAFFMFGINIGKTRRNGEDKSF